MTGARETDIRKNRVVRSSQQFKSSTPDLIKLDHIADILGIEDNDGFGHYIEWLGLSSDSKLVVLSSIHHYYYDAEEMKNVRTVINIKELNRIKDVNSFLNSMFLILPPKCHLIGCFVDSKKQNGWSFFRTKSGPCSDKKSENIHNGIRSNIPLLNTIFSFLDARPNKYLSAKHVNHLLGNNGFKVIDMTELEGMTFFCAQSLLSKDN